MTLRIRPLGEAELDEADRICRVAFGTLLRLPEPERFLGDADLVRTRWRAQPAGALAAEVDGALAGSCLARAWGRLGVLGPLTVRPGLWGRNVASALLEATIERFSALGVAEVGLFTLSDSPRHVALYERFGFWPRFLTTVMRAPVVAGGAPSVRLVSELAPGDRPAVAAAARALAEAVHPGLDVALEVEAIAAQGLGDTVLLEEDGALAGLAACHLGAGSEAGSGACYVKFGAVAPGPGAGARLARLVEACHALAARRGAGTLVAGVNAGREEAWRTLRGLGFRPHFQGVAMHRPNAPFSCRRGSFVIDDWR